MSETPADLPSLLTASDFHSIVGILSGHFQWGTTNSRRNFVQLALFDYAKASLFIGQLRLDTTPREAAEEVLLALSKAGEDAAGVHPLPLFLRHLADKLFDEVTTRLSKQLALQVELVGLVRSVPPAILGDAYRWSVQGLQVDRYPTQIAGQIGHLLDLEPGQGPVVPLLVFAARLSKHDAGLGDRFRIVAEPFARQVLGASAAQILVSANSTPASQTVVATLNGDDAVVEPPADVELKPAQWKPFKEALLSAFPNPGELRQVVRYGLEQNFAAITSGQTYADHVASLVEWAVSHGGVTGLVKAAREANPGNSKLRALAQALGLD